MTAARIVKLSAHRKQREKKQHAARPQQPSFYELYPMRFFDADRRSAWAVQPTGDYSEDRRTGEAYFKEFLKSCDGSILWPIVLQRIVADMIGQGYRAEHADGTRRCDGIVDGFMHSVGQMLSLMHLLKGEPGA
jgi:hypothetical protein